MQRRRWSRTARNRMGAEALADTNVTAILVNKYNRHREGLETATLPCHGSKELPMSTSTQYQQLTAKPAEVAAMLGYRDTKTVYGLIRTGKIRARKVGNTFLVNLSSVRKFAGEE